jgi:hypothetical protein
MKKLTIKAGKHRVKLKIDLNFNINSITKKFIFTESCRYILKSKSDQADICKLFGFSQGYHHRNSARFGWRYNLNSKKIEILAYMYLSGKRESFFLCNCDINEKYEFILTKKYHFIVKNNNQIIAEQKFKPEYKYNIGYKLYLFFGGNHSAPQDIDILNG